MTLLAFMNAWPDKLVMDDKAFAGPGRSPELDSVQYIFTHDLWATVGTTTGLYRPLLLLGLKLETQLFGDWLPGYHVSNILQHLLVTFLLFGFLRYLLRLTGDGSSSPDLYALLAAMVFAVHPVHTEVVNSVFNRSEMMVAFLGIAGLSWLLRNLDDHPARAWSGLGLVFFLGLFSRESAIVIPPLAVALILLLSPGDLFSRVRKCLPVFWLLIPLAIYVVMRNQALAPPETAASPDAGGFEAMLNLEAGSASNSLVAIAGALGASLKLIAWPYPLQLAHGSPPLPLSLAYAALQLCLIAIAILQYRQGRRGLAIGLAFFYIAMLPATQILSPGSTTAQVAERYLYFASVGLAILLAFAARALALRFGTRRVAGLTMPIVLLLTALTLDRNADWANEIALFGTEYERTESTGFSLRLVTSAYLDAREYARVVDYCDDNLESQENRGDSAFVQNCALAYEFERRDAEAERAHQFAIRFEATRVAASMSLARFYLRHGRPADAARLFSAAIDWADDPAAKALHRSEMIMSLHPGNRERWMEARSYLEEALRLKPGWSRAEKLLQTVNRALTNAADAEPEPTGF